MSRVRRQDPIKCCYLGSYGMLKSMAREKKKTTVIARTLRRSVGATYQQASKHGVTLGAR